MQGVYCDVEREGVRECEMISYMQRQASNSYLDPSDNEAQQVLIEAPADGL